MSKNINLEEDEIKNFLLTQKSSSQITSNTSRRKIAEISEGFYGQQSFFHKYILTFVSCLKNNLILLRTT